VVGPRLGRGTPAGRCDTLDAMAARLRVRPSVLTGQVAKRSLCRAILGADSTMRAVLCVPQAFVTAAAAKFRAVVEHHFHDSSIDAAAARRR
jgi:hypothetical protein